MKLTFDLVDVLWEGRPRRKRYRVPYAHRVHKPPRKWASSHPNKLRAQRAAQRAVRKGLIKRLPCRICSAVKVDAHHPDYNKPLDVVWLCRKHHFMVHRLLSDSAESVKATKHKKVAK